MDTILDKLSQKFTAQEIIKANSEADAKALERVQEQVQQYNNCLEEMKKVNGQTKLALSEIERTLQTGLENFKNAEIPTDSITRLVEDSLAQIKALQNDSIDVQNALEEKFAKQYIDLQGIIEDELTEQSENIQGILEAKMTKMNGDMQAMVEAKFADVNAEITDYIHKECVKVYRNVQAVQVDENEKQTTELTREISQAAKKAKAAWGVSIATLFFSAIATVGVVFELLVVFGILTF